MKRNVDEGYNDEGEGDITHISKVDDEESLRQPLRDPRFQSSNPE